jgi:hypothetical protein
MHDPMTVAFEIRRPWPDVRRTARGRRYWPSVVTVWHVEPGGHDSGEVCRHYRRVEGGGGKWVTTILSGWRWHVWHWRIQVHSLQRLRRRMLTRCAWCHGRHAKGDPVNVSMGWEAPRGKWWRGEVGLYHSDCSMVASAHRMCLCDAPDRQGGRCARCSRFVAYRVDPARQEQAALLAALDIGQRAPKELLAEHRIYGEAISAREASA